MKKFFSGRKLDVIFCAALVAITMAIISLSGCAKATAEQIAAQPDTIAGWTQVQDFCRFGYQFMLVENRVYQVYESSNVGSNPLPCKKEK